MPIAEPKEAVEPVVATAIRNAKAKNARMRLMKERNESYLAEQRDEEATDEERTKELRVPAESRRRSSSSE